MMQDHDRPLALHATLQHHALIIFSLLWFARERSRRRIARLPSAGHRAACLPMREGGWPHVILPLFTIVLLFS